jgi:hypothetical protein
LKLRNIEYGSLLSYCPRKADEEKFKEARKKLQFVKSDSMLNIRNDPKGMPMSQWIANFIAKRMDQLSFKHFFQTGFYSPTYSEQLTSGQGCSMGALQNSLGFRG